jgi:hypothetical protein
LLDPGRHGARRFGARRLSPRLRPLDSLPFALPIRPALGSTVGSTLGSTFAAFALLSNGGCRKKGGYERRVKCL